MTSDFLSRIIGMIVFALIGARLGIDTAPALGLAETSTSLIFSLVGILFGLILTPWFTVRPLRGLPKLINEMPVSVLLISLLGLGGGMLFGLLMAYPVALSVPDEPTLVPIIVMLLVGYLGMMIFYMRARDILGLMGESVGRRSKLRMITGAERQILLDTSVLIDGRITDIARTGFLGGILIVPRFVISELHQVADSSDALRRKRGQHGLEKLNELQRDDNIAFKVIEDDIPDMHEVDNKLVALALQMSAVIITNDYPLNRVAEAQGVTALNINLLSNAVRAQYLPGETFPLRVIQEGREEDQGVGYLVDGTMVVIEGGKLFLDRTIEVTVTRFINTPAGRMYFAIPADR
ncbi:MAG: PIN domain nuclease [Anaerolineaceae bacterium]|nr:PIN domain nuclease [Anaerolineaceae bacterium]